ncbi:DUF6257 family protein [Streptomyces uncialis]|uniref:DUF6257 family protein n=1 Tax=Streptomyces uncialis TaxID=1048205 RepID=UPI003868E999|nr:DUF6257 family protein [Streptomyces uncialis]
MPNSKNTTPQLTVGEKAQLAWLVARMAKRGLADPDRTGTGAVDLSDLQRKTDRIYERACKRAETAARTTK